MQWPETWHYVERNRERERERERDSSSERVTVTERGWGRELKENGRLEAVRGLTEERRRRLTLDTRRFRQRPKGYPTIGECQEHNQMLL